MLAPKELYALIDKTGYPVLMDEYGEDDSDGWRSIVDVRGVEDTNLYGEKIRVLQTMGRFRRRADGADVQDDTPKRGPVAYLAIHPYSRKFQIPKRLMDGANAVANITSIVQEHLAGFGRTAKLTKEDFIADIFQKGTLTAGSQEFFDGSFGDEADPNPTVIYDGLPWFDTAHTITGGSATFDNHDAGVALTKANLETAITKMTDTNAKDERNERISVRPSHLVVPPGLEFTARTILESTHLPGSANNDVNTSNGRLSLFVWRALDDSASSSAWWVVDASMGSGLRVRDSGAPYIESIYDPIKKVMHVTAEYLFGAGVVNWRFANCANKAAS